MIKDKKYKYLYRITNTINNKIYIGIHTTDNLDDNYMGSGHLIMAAIKKYGKEYFTKEILQYYDTIEELLEAERRVVNPEFVSRDDTYNLVIGSTTRYDTYTGKNRSEKLSNAVKGKVMVTDGIDCFYTDKDDIRYITHELVGITKGRVVYTNTLTGKNEMVYRDDPRIKSGELVHPCKGRTQFKDKFGNRVYTSVDDPRVLNGELVGITAGFTQSEVSNQKRSQAQLGIAKPQPYYECPICHKVTTKTNLLRWHKKCAEEFEKETNKRYSLNLKETLRD